MSLSRAVVLVPNQMRTTPASKIVRMVPRGVHQTWTSGLVQAALGMKGCVVMRRMTGTAVYTPVAILHGAVEERGGF